MATQMQSLRGVTRVGNRWMAQISIRGRSHYLGLFDTALQAHEAFLIAHLKLRGAPYDPSRTFSTRGLAERIDAIRRSAPS